MLYEIGSTKLIPVSSINYLLLECGVLETFIGCVFHKVHTWSLSHCP